MTINVINKLREETLRYFSRDNKVNIESEVFKSSFHDYRIVKSDFKQTKKDTNWFSSELEIYGPANEKIKTILIDDDRFFHTWIHINNTNYLIFSEIQCGGNSVFNLNTRILQSFSDGTDGFMCVDYCLSANGKMLAASGRYWGSPYLVVVYDVSNIEDLPWPILSEITLEDAESIELSWDSNNLVLYKEVDNDKLVSRMVKI